MERYELGSSNNIAEEDCHLHIVSDSRTKNTGHCGSVGVRLFVLPAKGSRTKPAAPKDFAGSNRDHFTRTVSHTKDSGSVWECESSWKTHQLLKPSEAVQYFSGKTTLHFCGGVYNFTVASSEIFISFWCGSDSGRSGTDFLNLSFWR